MAEGVVAFELRFLLEQEWREDWDSSEPGPMYATAPELVEIHLTLGGRSVAVRESIEEGRRMLDRLEAFVEQTTDDAYRADMADALETARLLLNSRLRE